MQKGELSLLIEMLKSDIQTSMRSHFEIFKNETEGGIGRKVEQKEMQDALGKKISTLEFWREIDYVKSMIHTVSRDLALAGLSGQSSGGGGSKSTSNSAIKTLIRQEIETKVDEERLTLALSAKADTLDLKDLVTRQNKLEAYVHERLNQRGKTEHDITHEMLKRDEEN